MSVEVFGQQLSMPIILSPVGLAGCTPGAASSGGAGRQSRGAALLAFHGWVLLHRSHRDRRAALVPALHGPRPGLHGGCLARAKAAKCPALLFTVDLPVPGRYRDTRNGMIAATAAAKINQAIDGISHPHGCGMCRSMALRTVWVRWLQLPRT